MQIEAIERLSNFNKKCAFVDHTKHHVKTYRYWSNV